MESDVASSWPEVDSAAGSATALAIRCQRGHISIGFADRLMQFQFGAAVLEYSSRRLASAPRPSPGSGTTRGRCMANPVSCLCDKPRTVSAATAKVSSTAAAGNSSSAKDAVVHEPSLRPRRNSPQKSPPRSRPPGIRCPSNGCSAAEGTALRAGRRPDPMALSLPWIGRQLDHSARGRLDVLPVQIATGRIGARTGLQQCFSLRPATAQRCQNRRRALART